MSVGKLYLESATKRLVIHKELAEKTFAQLEEKDLHFRPDEESNSIAIIIQHIVGNMLSRWTNFLTEDGEKPSRMRDDEFEVHSYSRDQLIELWEKGWDCFLKTLGSLTEDDLSKTVHIRGEALSVIDAINAQLAHYPYHIGQIIYIGKMIKTKDWKSLSVPKRK